MLNPTQVRALNRLRDLGIRPGDWFRPADVFGRQGDGLLWRSLVALCRAGVLRRGELGIQMTERAAEELRKTTSQGDMECSPKS